MPELIVYDGPEDRCFGCGQRNEQGLRLKFRRSENGHVEADYLVPDWSQHERLLETLLG